VISGVSSADYNESLRAFSSAGRAVSRALILAKEIVHEGMPVVELCERVEDAIRANGCEPGFPTNVSIDSVAAHYTASISDGEVLIPKQAIVKIDAGAHSKGYIADSALTVSFNTHAETLVLAAKNALNAAISALRVGVTVGEVGAAIEKAIRAQGVSPVVDLSGHTIERYSLHAGVNIANYANRSNHRLTAGTAFAIEPFATFGKGHIKDDREGRIYRGIRRVRSPIKFDQRVLEFAIEERKGMPFTDRWLRNTGSREEVLSSIRRLVRFGGLYEYKVLLESSGGLVSQFEHTIFMATDGPLVVSDREGD
jgi:methionyl aminopeptidase